MISDTFIETIQENLFILKKEVHQRCHPYAKNKKTFFIIGCQRSGTNLMLRLFANDLNTKTFDELSILSSEDEQKIRLNPLHVVNEEILRARAPLIILKPLVETQNILSLLEYFKGSKGLWMYRNYKDVASSNLSHFGKENGISDLRPIVENNPGDWRSEKVSKEVREIILQYFSDHMNPYDAAVLFWYSRNKLFFELGLDQNPNVFMCKYADLVTSPTKVIPTIYQFIDFKYSGNQIHEVIYTKSLKRGIDLELTPEIDQLAGDLLNQLDQIYHTKLELVASGKQ